MFSHLIIFLGSNCYAFDPVTAMATVQTVDSVFNHASHIDSAVELGEAINDLANESAVNPDLIRESEDIVKRLENLNSKISQTRQASNEIKDLLNFDLSRSKDLAGKLRNISQKIRQGKRLYSLIKGKGNSGPGLQIEQIRINQRILDELQNIRIGQFNQYLEDKERKVQLQVSLESSLKEEESNYQKRLKAFRSRRGKL